MIGAWLVLAAFAATVYAQFETATVLGTVRDTTNAVVPEATVTLTNTATGVAVTRTTNAEGQLRVLHGRCGHLSLYR